LARIVTYEILAVEEVGDEEIKLVRKGWRFRIISSPRQRLQAAVQSHRRELRSPEVAWRAFEFAVASERFWQAPICGSRDEARSVMLRAGSALRAAAIKHGDTPWTTD
jgi:hypothetical protein